MIAARFSRTTAIVAGALALASCVVVGVVLSPAQSARQQSPEYLSTASGAFAERAVSWFPDWVSLPAGYSRTAFGFAVAERLRPGRVAYVSRVRLEADFERYSRCLWMQDWMSAEVSNDLGGMTAAAIVLRKSATWPATVATAAGSVPGLRSMARSAAELELGPVSKVFVASCPPLPSTSTSY